jgi:hypothetical protein
MGSRRGLREVEERATADMVILTSIRDDEPTSGRGDASEVSDRRGVIAKPE